MKKFLLSLSVVAMLSIFFATTILLFTQLSFAQEEEQCLGNPDIPVSWEKCVVKKNGAFVITEPRVGTERHGWFPLHGILSIDGGLDLSTPHGFCTLMKRKLVSADQHWEEKPQPTIALEKNGTAHGPFQANFYYRELTCKR